MNRKRVTHPTGQQVKGIFVFHTASDTLISEAKQLMTDLDCEVLAHHQNRVMVRTTRSHLQAIKQCWLAESDKTPISQSLKQHVAQIIIGGKA